MVCIVGCNHGIQPARSQLTALDTPDQNDQRAHFEKMLRGILRECEIQIVCEEWGDVEETIAQTMARETQLAWRDINTSNADKDRMGIPRDYVQGPYSDGEKRNWNGLRERFMLDRINEYRADARNLLIVCGFAHLDVLAESLGANDEPVKPVDYRRFDWYRPGVFAGDA